MRYQSYNNGPNFLWIGLLILLFFGGFKLLLGIFGIVLVIFVNFLPMILIGWLLMTLARSVKKNTSINDYLKHQSPEHNRFMELTVRTVVHVMKADGKIEESEKQLLFAFFAQVLRYGETEMTFVTDIFEKSVAHPHPLEELCIELSQFNYESRLLLIDLVYRIAMADHEFHAEENKLIQRMVGLLKINPMDHQSIRARYDLSVQSNQSKKDHHYTILGVKPGASKDDIKKAYKEAIKKNHPDKVHHLGEEFRKVAEEKMREINASYKALAS
ncbi:MAG: TerB family tellurite resistance protein [Candidatus Margulisbacteria bacterium]|nr:TerB family tellurite resistance protein [Candidatus Margulisiibacteriota bacterium]